MSKSVIFLVGCPDERGVLYFLSGPDGLRPGLPVTLSASSALVDQLYHALEATLSLPHHLGVDLEVSPDFAEAIWDERPPASTPTLLYLGKLDPKYLEKLRAHGAKTLPDLLRDMTPNKSRAAYLKAFQFFAGTAKEALRVIEHKT